MELCGILGISINEFLAGEDISRENIIEKSEDNLIQVTKDSKSKQKYLKKIITVLTLVTIITAVLAGTAIYYRLSQPKNYVAVISESSAEGKTARLLSGADGAFLFKFFSKDKFRALDVYLSKYQSGELVTKSKVAELSYDDRNLRTEGMLVFLPVFEKFEIQLVVTDNYSKYKTSIPVLEGVEDRTYYGRSSSQITENIPIEYDVEQGLIAFIYSDNELSAIPVEEIGKETSDVKNDYLYFFSFKFQK